MTKTEISAVKDLVVHSFYGTNPDPTKFSTQDIKDSLRNEIHKIANDYYSYQKNKWDLFEIMQEAYTEILPKEIENFIGAFAEVKTVPLNQTAQFKIKRGRRRAKQFITTVALSGVYESFRLDSDTFEVKGRAIGGAAYIDFERYLCGDEDIAESTELLFEGLQDALYREIQKALLAAVNAEDRPAANKAYSNGFDPVLMRRLCDTARVYSSNGGVTIYATPEFVSAMGPEAVGLPIVYGNAHIAQADNAVAAATPVYNPRNIEEIAQYGRIKTFQGNPIVELPQSFTDERNETYVMNPAAAYIFPNGDTKPVKVVFEGPTQFNEWSATEGQRDRNFEIEVYQRVGVAILTNYDWCIYVNGELMDQDKYPTKYQLEINKDTFYGDDKDETLASNVNLMGKQPRGAQE